MFSQKNEPSHIDFYSKIDRELYYSICIKPEEHAGYKHIIKFINDYKLHDKKCLEIGSAKGIYQNIVNDYTGLDISPTLSKYYSKPYVIINKDGTYPFENNTFDAVWCYEVHEHIPDLDQALLELKRVLKPGGVVFFAPAWQCRPWAAEGYAVRPFSDFRIKGKIIKFLIPLRDSVFWRAVFVIPCRLYRFFLFIIGKQYNKIIYKKIKANYNIFWTSDSDACNSIEAFDAILWFMSNGFKCLSHHTYIKQLTLRHGLLIFHKKS